MQKLLSILLLFAVLAGCTQDTALITQKKDDWQYNPQEIEKDSTSAITPTGSGGLLSAMPSMESALSKNIGLAVGGANDINNFRENIENNYLPLYTDITYEGLFYDYYFDTGQTTECKELFCPTYTQAISPDPLSGDTEYYLSVGLNSGIKENDFQRKKLNLVIVLDISGSMGSTFDSYYYDNLEADYIERKTKMNIAKESVIDLLSHLHDDDRFGMILFDDMSYLAKPLSKVRETDIDSIEDHIKEIQAAGGTNMEIGYSQGTSLFTEYLNANSDEYENRIIFLTDAMPNTGITDEKSLINMTDKNAENGIYTTFIGIGVDFNTELTELITKTRGANYYSVHNEKEFNQRMDDEFEYMVTPLIFDLKLQLETTGWEIEKVYGSPEADAATGEIMYVNTLFPSSTEAGETKGGIIVLKLKKTGENGTLKLTASYQDRTGTEYENEQNITFTTPTTETFENTGIRKAILLARYANLIKNWIFDERNTLAVASSGETTTSWTTSDPCLRCPIPLPPVEPELGQWERQSIELKVSAEYQEIFLAFKEYFESEITEIEDNTLEQETDILYKLINYES